MGGGDMLAKAWQIVTVFRRTFSEFLEDECMSMGAALAFYAMFSIPPILIILITVVGLFIGSGQAKEELIARAQVEMGPQIAQQLEKIHMQQREGTGRVATILGAIALVFGATGVMAQLQTALDRAWDVAPDPRRGSILNTIVKRSLSFAMILIVAILLLASVVLSTLLAAFGDVVTNAIGHGAQALIWQWLNSLISWLIIAVLFAALFKVLPDAKVAWRDVWVGALVTAVLFVIGKYFLALYLGRASVGSPYGAAGSLALLLVWIYYTSLIFLFGAEFTQVWAQRDGGQIPAAAGAVKTGRKTRKVV